MCIPVILLGQSLVNAVVEVFVVGEDNMSTDIVELSACYFCARVEGQLIEGRRTKPSGVISVEAKPPGVSFESMINHDGPSCAYVSVAVEISRS